jgi:hypothetical protein
MNDNFDALMKRSFAEAPEPADDGFAVNVGHAVARRERTLKLRSYFQYGALTLGAAAVSYGLYSFVGGSGQELAATFGGEAARVQGALSVSSGDATGAAQGIMQTLGAGFTQILLVTAALAGGAVAFRATQD